MICRFRPALMVSWSFRDQVCLLKSEVVPDKRLDPESTRTHLWRPQNEEQLQIRWWKGTLKKSRSYRGFSLRGPFQWGPQRPVDPKGSGRCWGQNLWRFLEVLMFMFISISVNDSPQSAAAAAVCTDVLHIWTAAGKKTSQGGPTCSPAPRGPPEAPKGNRNEVWVFVYVLLLHCGK